MSEETLVPFGTFILTLITSYGYNKLKKKTASVDLEVLQEKHNATLYKKTLELQKQSIRYIEEHHKALKLEQDKVYELEQQLKELLSENNKLKEKGYEKD